ncbi:hypothetical protein BGY98DRAFT_1102808 [Russula aff. rugulosa BPL654]|nr:hypothetical protein BGY98DRAFT_1102808 [Russula aff. rugulosa BPL654]
MDEEDADEDAKERKIGRGSQKGPRVGTATSVRTSRFKDNEVGFVTGRVTTNTSSNIPVLDSTN